MEIKPLLTSPYEVKKILNNLDHRPSRKLGQNYLIDSNVLDAIIVSADLHKEDKVLEIGPGLGSLTERILETTNHLSCIEKDAKMVNYLEERIPNLDIRLADVLSVDLNDYFTNGFNKVIANLPYSISSRLMVEISECIVRPKFMHLMIQKEVADKLLARPGTKSYGVLSVLISFFYDCSLCKKVSPKCFFPNPKVWSSIIKMEEKKEIFFDSSEYPFIKKLIKYCFSQRRKQIATSLKNMKVKNAENILLSLEISPKDRPEVLQPLQWVSLARHIQKNVQ